MRPAALALSLLLAALSPGPGPYAAWAAGVVEVPAGRGQTPVPGGSAAGASLPVSPLDFLIRPAFGPTLSLGLAPGTPGMPGPAPLPAPALRPGSGLIPSSAGVAPVIAAELPGPGGVAPEVLPRSAIGRQPSPDPASSASSRRASSEEEGPAVERLRELEEGESELSETGPAPEAEVRAWRQRFDGAGWGAALRDPVAFAQPGPDKVRAPRPWSVRLTPEFQESVNALASLRRGRRQPPWTPERRNALVEQLRATLFGDKGHLEASRGRAGELGIWKFKWTRQGMRIFVHLDEEARTVTLLDVRLKSRSLAGSPLPELEIMNPRSPDETGDQAQARFYEKLADRVERGLQGTRNLSGEAGALWQRIRQMEKELKRGVSTRRARRRLKPPRQEDRESYAQAPRDPVPAPPGSRLWPGPALSLPGLEPLDSPLHRRPFGLALREAAYLGAHGMLLAAAVAALAAGLGLFAVLGGLTLGGGHAFWAYRRARAAIAAQAPALSRDAVFREGERFLALSGLREEDKGDKDLWLDHLRRVDGVLALLAGRLGAAQAPSLALYADVAPDERLMHVRGQSLGPAAMVGVGGYRGSSEESLAGLLAHELGHLQRGIPWYKRVRNLNAAWAATNVFAAFTVYSFLAALPGLILGFAPAAWLAAGIAALVSWALFGLALLAGLARARAEELSMDHFSAWLTGHPEWLMAYFQEEQALDPPRAGGEFARLWARLIASHPSHSARARFLQSLVLRKYGGPERLPPWPGKPGDVVILKNRAYLLGERIDGGRGNSGAVYRVAGQPGVVLKLIHPEFMSIPYYGGEVEALQTLARTGIPHARLRAFSADHSVLVKDFLGGPSMSELLEDGSLSMEQIVELVGLVADLIELRYNADLGPANLAWDEAALRWGLMDGGGFEFGSPWQTLRQFLAGDFPERADFTPQELLGALRLRLGPDSPAWRRVVEEGREVPELGRLL